MPTEFDASDFVDSDFQPSRKTAYASTMSSPSSSDFNRPPTREEVDTRVGEAQNKLAELKRAQEELERERANLEELRRRQMEFQTGRDEMLQNLTRGLGLLEESEFAARRDAEQMSKAVYDLKEALQKLQNINDQTWSKDNFNVELTRALTTIENARMEWNSARLKFSVLSGEAAAANASPSGNSVQPAFASQNFIQLLKLGFALTWPLVLLGTGIFVMLLLLLLRR
jgi:chromosome segregation ATPase